MDSKDYVLESMKNIGVQAVEKLQAEAPEMDGTAIIEQEGYVPDFDPDKHQYLNWKTGEVVRDNEQVWQLIQPYDSTIYKERPENMRAQWGLCHTKNPKKAKPYVEPLGTSGLYMMDECCLVEGKVYISKIDNNSWYPLEYPDGWHEYEGDN